jgi:hypothetical protein
MTAVRPSCDACTGHGHSAPDHYGALRPATTLLEQPGRWKPHGSARLAFSVHAARLHDGMRAGAVVHSGRVHLFANEGFLFRRARRAVPWEHGYVKQNWASSWSERPPLQLRSKPASGKERSSTIPLKVQRTGGRRPMNARVMCCTCLRGGGSMYYSARTGAGHRASYLPRLEGPVGEEMRHRGSRRSRRTAHCLGAGKPAMMCRTGGWFVNAGGRGFGADMDRIFALGMPRTPASVGVHIGGGFCSAMSYASPANAYVACARGARFRRWRWRGLMGLDY